MKRRRFVCIGCSGGCEYIKDSYDDDENEYPPKCKHSSCNWKELQAEGIPCGVCNSTDTFVGTFNNCDNCLSIEKISNG